MRHFRAYTTTFDNPSDIDDCTVEMYRPEHEDELECRCELQQFKASCSEVHCRRCGGRVA